MVSWILEQRPQKSDCHSPCCQLNTSIALTNNLPLPDSTELLFRRVDRGSLPSRFDRPHRFAVVPEESLRTLPSGEWVVATRRSACSLKCAAGTSFHPSAARQRPPKRRTTSQTTTTPSQKQVLPTIYSRCRHTLFKYRTSSRQASKRLSQACTELASPPT